MCISQLINDNGNAAANQSVISNGNGTFFQSYSTIIARIDNNGKLTLSKAWNFSKTTSKHLYIFLRDNDRRIYANRKAILKGIKNGEIEVVPTLVA